MNAKVVLTTAVPYDAVKTSASSASDGDDDHADTDEDDEEATRDDDEDVADEVDDEEVVTVIVDPSNIWHAALFGGGSSGGNRT